MNNLFTSSVDRTATQLAYTVKYSPFNELTPQAKQLISWRRALVMRKEQFVRGLDEEMTTYTYINRKYLIVWANNNVPTQIEWERKSPRFLLTVDMRFSPAIKELAVAILSFKQDTYKPLGAHKLQDQMTEADWSAA